jgi:type II restriction/modification system DNA methylase subunit YeeA
MEIFDAKKNETINLIEQINKTEREIDQIVYELFGLTADEIKVVEEATS